jgi:hypothetical protein
MASSHSGYGIGVELAALRARNWPALAALWALGSIWITIAFLIALDGLFGVEPPEAVGWVLLAVAIVGFVLALAGISSIRSRGETAVAIAALAVGLALPSGGMLFFYGLFGGVGLE